MPEPAFLVEGQMEQLIVQRLCMNKPVRLIGCNGDNASMTAVAKAINVHMRRLTRYHPIIILLDRERRTETCEQLQIELGNLLDQYGYEGKYIVNFADRTLENWILSDWLTIMKQDAACKPLDRPAEGCHGKSVLRRLLPKHIVYHETTIGVELFLKCRPSEMFSNSTSFRRFAESLDIDCWWLRSLGSGLSIEPDRL